MPCYFPRDFLFLSRDSSGVTLLPGKPGELRRMEDDEIGREKSYIVEPVAKGGGGEGRESKINTFSPREAGGIVFFYLSLSRPFSTPLLLTRLPLIMTSRGKELTRMFFTPSL